MRKAKEGIKMLVTPELSEEIGRILPQLQRELATEMEFVMQNVDELLPTADELEELMEDEDMSVFLDQEIEIWRRYYA